MLSPSGPRKAAILLATLGSAISAEVFRYCTESEIERVTAELLAMDDLGQIAPEVQDQVLDEAFQLSATQGGLPASALERVWEMLAQFVGESTANEMLKRLRSGDPDQAPFSFMEGTDAGQLASFLENEHPQITALILTYLKPRHAADILSHLSPDLQRDLAERILLMDQVSSGVVREVEQNLSQRLSPMLSRAEYGKHRGIDSLVAILKRVNRGTEKTILEHFKANPQLAEQIRQKMFIFEDLILLDDVSVQNEDYQS